MAAGRTGAVSGGRGHRSASSKREWISSKTLKKGPGEDYIFIRQTDEVGLGNAVLQDSQGEDFVPETQFDDSQIVATDAGNEPNMLGTLVYMHP